jgi:glucose/arabinose dehydrogenase
MSQVQDLSRSTARGVMAALPGVLMTALLACGSSSNPEGGVTPPPAAIPTCQGGGVIYDTGGTNGFGRQYVTDTNIPAFAPIDLAFIPGSASAFVVASQGGYLHYFNGGCAPINTVDLRTILPVGSSSGEQGLLNVEFHPDYGTNHYVFFYHTRVESTVNAITRMTVSFTTTGVLALSDPVRIIDFRKADTATAGNHNGGGLVFAPDKSLLASVGDGGASSITAQDNRRLLGKVIRIAPNLTPGAGGYTIPTGNMFAAANAKCSDVAQSAADCPEILAMGLRNPFRMSIDGSIVFLGDVGSDYEEINSFDYTRNTVNFGWPTHDGPVTSSAISGYRNPIVSYRRNIEAADFRAEDPMATQSGSASVIIGDVYRGANYAGLLDGALFFGDFYDGFNRYVGVTPGSDGNGVITDNDGVPGTHLVHENAVSSMVRGPDGFVYLTTLFDSPAVYRLVRP